VLGRAFLLSTGKDSSQRYSNPLMLNHTIQRPVSTC
jgi:hypothetical protein